MFNIRTRTDGEATNLAIEVTSKSPSTGELVAGLRSRLQQLDLVGGSLCMITGNLTIPLSMVAAHYAVHRFKAVAVFDPSIGRYVIVVSHAHHFRVGDAVVHHIRNDEPTE